MRVFMGYFVIATHALLRRFPRAFPPVFEECQVKGRRTFGVSSRNIGAFSHAPR
jgi:hypothetical protein